MTGGVYLATDLDSGKTVIIKEARPNTAVDPHGEDAVRRLRREYEILGLLSGKEVVPEPLNYFQEWEHDFLVEEYVAGLDLGNFTSAYTPLNRHGDNHEAMKLHSGRLIKIWQKIAEKLDVIHQYNVICGDISVKNVILVDGSDFDIRFTDFEASWRTTIDKFSWLLLDSKELT